MIPTLRGARWTAALLLLSAVAAAAAPFVFPPTADEPATGQPLQPGQEAPNPPGTTNRVESTPPPKNSLMERDSMTGNWGGTRDRLIEKGIAFTPAYQAEVFGNTGGRDQGAFSDGLFNFAIDLELGRLTGFWKNSQIHANALYIYGPSISARNLGVINPVSNLESYNSLRLQELWLEQNLWEKRFSIRAGLLAADTEFFTSDSAGLFINSTFGAFPLIAVDFYNSPIYPLADPGVRLAWAPNAQWYVKAAVFGDDSSSDLARNNQNGTRFGLRASDGALFFGEIGYLVNQEPNAKGLVGSYKLGTFLQRGQYPTFASQADQALGTGSLSGKGTNYAVYGVADQEVYKTDERKITLFARGGGAPKCSCLVDGYAECGCNLTGFLPGRPQDIAGLAVGYSHVSGDFSDAEKRRGLGGFSHETVLEATYKIVLAPWWSLQPDFQYIVDPSGARDATDAFVLGLRTTVAF